MVSNIDGVSRCGESASHDTSINGLLLTIAHISDINVVSSSCVKSHEELVSCSMISMWIALVTRQDNNRPHRFLFVLPPLVRRNVTLIGPNVSIPT